MRSRGFSLLEVLIAMTILSIGVFGAMKLFPMTLRQVRAAQERTVATELADDRFSRLRAAGGRNLSFMSVELPSPVFSLTTAEDVYSGYTTTASLLADAESVHLQRATFLVKMPDGRYERFVTLIAEP